MAFLELGSEKLYLKFRARKQISWRNVSITRGVQELPQSGCGENESEQVSKAQMQILKMQKVTLKLISLLFDDSHSWKDKGITHCKYLVALVAMTTKTQFN